jgi:hypothetical protein
MFPNSIFKRTKRKHDLVTVFVITSTVIVLPDAFCIVKLVKLYLIY